MLVHEIALSEWEQQRLECARAALLARRMQKLKIESPDEVQDSLGARPKEGARRSGWGGARGDRYREERRSTPKKFQSIPCNPFITNEH
jgi:hypothetical protein